MKCHYVYDKIAGKVLIPGCWSVINSDDTNDIKNCTCKDYSAETFAQFEKQIYRDILLEKNKEIKELERENDLLHKIMFKRKIPYL
jgi:hypothetical protein